MAGGIVEDEDDVIASINMVPFIDICLVLLIIFMVTSSYIVQQAIEVDLPQAASGGNVAPSALAIVVEADRTVSLNGEVISMEALGAAVEREVALDETVQAIIAADRTVDYGVVMDVVDEVKIHGIRTFALNIDREEAP